MSRAVTHFSERELYKLLSVAREQNKLLGITGMLLYDNEHTFIQVLEGKRKQVQEIYQKIEADSRHTELEVVSEQYVLCRNFSDWYMGFSVVDPVLKSDLIRIKGYAEISAHNFDEKKAKGIGLVLLNSFKQQSEFVQPSS